MIAGIGLCLHLNIYVLDYQSNALRFIKLSHDTHNILNINKDIDYNNNCCQKFKKSSVYKFILIIFIILSNNQII